MVRRAVLLVLGLVAGYLFASPVEHVDLRPALAAVSAVADAAHLPATSRPTGHPVKHGPAGQVGQPLDGVLPVVHRTPAPQARPAAVRAAHFDLARRAQVPLNGRAPPPDLR
ncbi:hypothetical protein [Actinosynnema pretiosum]|uniref:Uncharacterized protein n=1 Tax=Actinosynnema pretiosum TaxID=42197 RepID=A0A290Z1D7_9PSEU|nr:hypothetical protein [Actinosynnema pretiosum]ATE52785.1 hypothetical protein CNX65_05390 [Actinosynnema pretiosum]